MKKTFSLRVLLTVTTGRLLTVPKDGGNGIGDYYEILNHMTRDSLMTHQLPRVSGECKPWLLKWFPELEPVGDGATLDKWLESDSTGTGQEGIKMWLAELRMMFPSIREEYEVDHIPADDHVIKDPYDELVEMLGTDEGIEIVN